MAISSNQNASAPAEKSSKQPPPFVLEVDEEVNSACHYYK